MAEDFEGVNDAGFDARGASFDPYAEDEVYGAKDEDDEEEEEEEEEELGSDIEDEEGNFIRKAWKKKKYDNPHDRENPEVLLEEKYQIQTHLEDERDKAKEELARLQNSRFQVNWKSDTAIPAQLVRLDAPWLKKAEKQLAEEAAKRPAGGTEANKTTDRAGHAPFVKESPGGGGKKGKKGKDGKGKKGKREAEKVTEEKEEEKKDLKVLYAAKLVSNLYICVEC